MANDFSGDANCKSLWRFENGALDTATIGNNFTTSLGAAADTDPGDFQEGAASAYYSGANKEQSLTDAQLPAGFPMKNGDVSPDFSICFFAKITSFGGDPALLVNKGQLGATSSFFTFWNNIGNHFMIGIGWNGGVSVEWIDDGLAALSTGNWYHFGITWSDATKAWHIRIWDIDGAGLHGDNTGIAVRNMNIDTGRFASNYDSANGWVGWIDELVVFDDILSSDEIDEIRQGIYAPGGGGASGNALLIGSDF